MGKNKLNNNSFYNLNNNELVDAICELLNSIDSESNNCLSNNKVRENLSLMLCFTLGDLKQLDFEIQVEYLRVMIKYGNCIKKGSKDMRLFIEYILGVDTKILAQLTEEELEQYNVLFREVLGKRKYTNMTPGAPVVGPLLKKVQVGVCKLAARFLSSKDVEIISFGLKIKENDDGIMSYEEVPVAEILPDEKNVIYWSSHQCFFDNLMSVISKPSHSVILHNKDASTTIRQIQWPTGLNEVDRDDSVSRQNSKYDILTGIFRKFFPLSTEIFPEATWNRSMNRYLLKEFLGVLKYGQRAGVDLPVVPVAYYYVYGDNGKIVKAYAVYGETIYVGKNDMIFPLTFEQRSKLISEGKEVPYSIGERLRDVRAALKDYAISKNRQAVGIDYNYLISEYASNGVLLRESDARELSKSLIVELEGNTYTIDDLEYIKLEYERHGCSLSNEKLEELANARKAIIMSLKSSIVEEYVSFLKATDTSFAGGNVGQSDTKYVRESSQEIIPVNELPVQRDEVDTPNGIKYNYRIGLTPSQMWLAGLAPHPDVVSRNNLMGTFVKYVDDYNDCYYSKKEGLVIGGNFNGDEYLFVVLNSDGKRVYVSEDYLYPITDDVFSPRGVLASISCDKKKIWTPTGDYFLYKNTGDLDEIALPQYNVGDIIEVSERSSCDIKEKFDIGTKVCVVERTLDRRGVVVYGLSAENFGMCANNSGRSTVYVSEQGLFDVVDNNLGQEYNLGDVLYKRSTTCGVPDTELTVRFKRKDKDGRMIYILWDGRLHFEMLESNLEYMCARDVFNRSLSK